MKWSRFSTRQQVWWRDESLRFQIRHRREDDQYVLYDHERGERGIVSFWPTLRIAQAQAAKLAGDYVLEPEEETPPPVGVPEGKDGVPALGELHVFHRRPDLAWRYDSLILEGFSFDDSERIALAQDADGRLIDWRRLVDLVAEGCDLSTAEEIVR